MATIGLAYLADSRGWQEPTGYPERIIVNVVAAIFIGAAVSVAVMPPVLAVQSLVVFPFIPVRKRPPHGAFSATLVLFLTAIIAFGTMMSAGMAGMGTAQP